ncbi:MAG TPA: hypothetical protein VMR49_03690 [Candidatus Paceibacterota bacterium]|nr:hypothetical protein [Candidatus Paceibacterota bacterium]
MKRLLFLLFSFFASLSCFAQEKFNNIADQISEDQTLIENLEKFGMKKIRKICYQQDSVALLTFISKVDEEKKLFPKLICYLKLKSKQREKIKIQIADDLEKFDLLQKNLENLRPQILIIYQNCLRSYH